MFIGSAFVDAMSSFGRFVAGALTQAFPSLERFFTPSEPVVGIEPSQLAVKHAALHDVPQAPRDELQFARSDVSDNHHGGAAVFHSTGKSTHLQRSSETKQTVVHGMKEEMPGPVLALHKIRVDAIEPEPAVAAKTKTDVHDAFAQMIKANDNDMREDNFVRGNPAELGPLTKFLERRMLPQAEAIAKTVAFGLATLPLGKTSDFSADVTALRSIRNFFDQLDVPKLNFNAEAVQLLSEIGADLQQQIAEDRGQNPTKAAAYGNLAETAAMRLCFDRFFLRILAGKSSAILMDDMRAANESKDQERIATERAALSRRIIGLAVLQKVVNNTLGLKGRLPASDLVKTSAAGEEILTDNAMEITKDYRNEFALTRASIERFAEKMMKVSGPSQIEKKATAS